MRLTHSKVSLPLAILILLPNLALAWGDSCKFTGERAAGIDAKGVEKIVLRTGAGDLKVLGRSTAVRIEARGVACATNQALLDAAQITVRREGNVVFVESNLPQDDPDHSSHDNGWAYIDTGVALPANIPVEAIDSSGDAVFEGMRSLTLQDSSGDLDIDNIAELADVTDSSGDLRIDGAGSVRVRDSSGDVEVDQVRSDVEVLLDSSGDIHVANVGGNVTVTQDSSGSIRIEDVKGSVSVAADSSGDIYAGRVGGDFSVGDDSSGSIDHEDVRGKVVLPPGHESDEN